MPKGTRRRNARRVPSPKDKQVLLNILREGLINDWVDAGGSYAVVNLEAGINGIINGVAVIFDGGFECVNCKMLYLREEHKTNLCGNCKLELAKKKTEEAKVSEIKPIEGVPPEKVEAEEVKEPSASG